MQSAPVNRGNLWGQLALPIKRQCIAKSARFSGRVARCVPLVVLLVGWHREGAPPGCGCSGRSHRGPSAGCSAACPPTRRGGCSATEEYTSACPAALVEMCLPPALLWSPHQRVKVSSDGDREGIGLPSQCQITHGETKEASRSKRPEST